MTTATSSTIGHHAVNPDLSLNHQLNRSTTGSSGGFTLPVHGHDLFIGLKQSRNGSRAGFQHE